MSIVTRKLIAKELYVHRWFVTSSAVAAVLSIGVASLGRMAFNVGALTWMTTIIAFGVMLAIYGVVNERKEHSLEFVLGLPLSTAEFVRAKQFGLLLCYLPAWAMSTAAAVVLVLAGDAPDGLLPYALALCGFMLANFAVVLCGALHARTEAMTTTVIIITNMAVSIYMFTVGALPGFRDHMFGAVPVWNSTFFYAIGGELIVIVIALTLPLLIAARRRDFI